MFDPNFVEDRVDFAAYISGDNRRLSAGASEEERIDSMSLEELQELKQEYHDNMVLEFKKTQEEFHHIEYFTALIWLFPLELTS